MSSDSLAALRKNVGPELAKMAEEHLQHDLFESDRETLRSAASTLSRHATTGTLLGLSLGLLLALRLRRNRARAFDALRSSAEQPTVVRLSSGRELPLPDLAPLLKPSVAGDVAAALLFGAGGLFLGGEVGLLTGGSSAKRQILADPEARQRIERAWRRFRADMLRKELEGLERGEDRNGNGEGEGVLGEKWL